MRIGITITKETAFRGKPQEFHNTYYFELATAITAPAESLVDEITATEKSLHSTIVTFKRAAVWSAGGTQAQNQMLFQKALTGTGNQTHELGADRERAVLVQWKAGFSTTGKQVYLRKWYHSCGSAAGVGLQTSGITSQTAQIPTADRATIATKADENRSVGTGEFWELCAKSGRKTTDPAVTHRYLEHHQLGEQWR
jgi:hypothetical protein